MNKKEQNSQLKPFEQEKVDEHTAKDYISEKDKSMDEMRSHSTRV